MRRLPFAAGHPVCCVNTEVAMFTMRLSPFAFRRLFVPLLILTLAALASAPLSRAQTEPQTQPQTPQPTLQPQDQTAPAAGGPAGDNGAIALPKKKDNPADAAPPAP